MKTCSKCNETQPLGDFYPRSNKCKNCTRRAVREREERLSQDPAWVLSERQRHRDYMRARRESGLVPKPDREKRRLTTQKYRTNNRHKARAVGMVNDAIRRGALIPQPCEKCGKKAEAHHDDYSRPLDVRWLCPKHHGEHHAAMRDAELLSQLK